MMDFIPSGLKLKMEVEFLILVNYFVSIFQFVVQ